MNEKCKKQLNWIEIKEFRAMNTLKYVKNEYNLKCFEWNYEIVFVNRDSFVILFREHKNWYEEARRSVTFVPFCLTQKQLFAHILIFNIRLYQIMNILKIFVQIYVLSLYSMKENE